MVPLFIPLVNGRARRALDRVFPGGSRVSDLPFSLYGDTIAHYGSNTPNNVAAVS